MRDRLLETLAGWALHRPGRTLLVLLALTVLAATRLPLLGVDAGHSGMMDADRPAQVRLRTFEARFGSPNQLVVLVEGGDEAARRAAVDALTTALPGGRVRDAMGRVDRAAMAELALFFADGEGARAAVDGLVGGGLARVRSLASPRHLLTALSAELSDRSAEPAPEGDAAEARARDGMDAVARLLDALTATLKAPGAPPLMRAMLPAEAAAPGLDDAGYLSSTDGDVKLVLVRPTLQSDDPVEVVPFVDDVRARAAAAVQGVAPAVEVTLTGMPALIADEAAAIQSDMWVTGIYATAGLLLVLGIGYRSVRRTLLALAPLPFVLVWTLAFVQVAFGSLNLLTGAVVPVLLGLCIDASVHLLARFDEARLRLDVSDAVRDAIHGVGPGLLTGVFTTSGAFFALVVTDFRGFREMGLMTAFGLVAGLAVTSTLLPALLTLPGLSFFRAADVAPPRAVRAGAAVQRFARPIVVGGLVLLGASLWIARAVPWSYDWVALLPDTPATAALARLEARTGYSASGAAVEVDSLDDAGRVAAALTARATVARAETAIDLLPTPSTGRAEALRRLPPAGAPAPPEPTDADSFGEAADELADALEDAWLDARRASSAQAAWLEAPRTAARRLADAYDALPEDARPAALARLAPEVRALRDTVLGMTRRARAAPTGPPEVVLAALPAPVAGRLASEGRYAVYAYPKDDLGARDALERFVADLQAVAVEATGFPVVHLDNMRSIRFGFVEASWIAVSALFLLLLVDFRSPRYALLAVVPLGVGVVWTWAVVTLTGMKYNAGNVVSLPLVLGIAVDAGVHLLHRWRQQGERDAAGVVRYTGGAVLLSGVTTIVGFGSLALASHRATASFGTLLLVGVTACLLAAVAFLPAVLHLLRRPTNEETT